MDLFKKGTLKSQSLNSRFLSANNGNHGQQTLTPSQTLSSQLRSLPLQPLESSSHNPPPLVSHQSSKLKLTTSRQSSSLRLNREQQNASPSATTTTPEAASTGPTAPTNHAPKDPVPDKKLPVWNKGVPVLKPTKSYTDEELKAMHGISLVSRNSMPGEKKENRWDDSDEDDDWGDTIDFGDGTKVVIGQPDRIEPHPIEPIASTIPEEPLPPISLPPLRDLKDPWKAPEPTVVRTPDLREFPDVHAARKIAAATQDPPPSSSNDDVPSSRGKHSDIDNERRYRSDSLGRESRMQTSGDARYQYDQNTFDRRWHNPPPSTREIYDPNTGKLEQIDSTQQRAARRPSHNDRKPPELMQRASHDAKHSKHSETPANGGNLVSDRKTPLDPSSQELAEMQKQLMSTARAQAIQRRKDQEAEDAARKERARKKAAELAASAEKEAAEKQAQLQAKLDARKAKEAERVNARYGTNDRKEKAQTATSSNAVTSDKKTSAEKWQRGTKLLPRSEKSLESEPELLPQATNPETSKIPSTESETLKPLPEESEASNRSVWGPIGPKSPISTLNRKESPAHDHLPKHDVFRSNKSQEVADPISSIDDIRKPNWSAFDGMNKTGGKPREYNVYDAADEPLTPERISKPSHVATQSQSNRTSSRFFPSPASAQQAPKQAQLEPASMPFSSPILPPRIDMPEHLLYDILKSPMSLQLPAVHSANILDRDSRSYRGVEQVISSIKATVKAPVRGKYSRLDTQSRNVWEVKAPKEGLKPRVRLPQAEKQLEWTRKAIIEESEKSSQPEQALPKPVVTHALPLQAAWAMPETLEVMSRTSNFQEPLLPPSPSVKLPTVSEPASAESSPHKRKNASRFEQERISKYYTTKPSLLEEIDHMSPIRIKLADQDVTKIPRKFGKRAVENTNSAKKVADVKRQPINMSDAPQDASNSEQSGFKRGFTTRVRKAPPGLESPVVLRRENGHVVAPALAPQGPPGITLPARMQ